MFDRFIGAYGPGTPHPKGAGQFPDGAPELMTRFGGYTFRDGLYRLHTAASARLADERVREAWPDRFADRIACFGFDWRGRQFSRDPARRDDDGEPLVLLYEWGTGDALEIPATLAGFHDEILIDMAEQAVEVSAFEDWRRGNPDKVPLAHEECVGYRVPLFLGGEDDASNLEVSDTDVYMSIMGGLAVGIRESGA
jgi:hypothetical protein